MAKVKINEKEYNMRFSLYFWERIKAEAGITQANMQEKLNDDFGKNSAVIVQYGIFFGIPMNERPISIEKMENPTVDEIKDCLDYSVLDAIEQTFIEGMTMTQRKLVEKAKEVQEKTIDSIGKKKE